jgi:hypothetical protein
MGQQPPSVQPQWSFAGPSRDAIPRIPFAPRPIPFPEMFANITRWLRHARPGEGEKRLADGLVKRMIAEADDAVAQEGGDVAP